MFANTKIRNHRIIASIFLLGTMLSPGCKKVSDPSIGDYVPLTISEIRNNSPMYQGKNISVEGYVLGAEVRKDPKIGHIWIMVIGEHPFDSGTNTQLIFPDIENKIRVGETGYNSDIMERCHEASQKLKARGDLVKVYGTVSPALSMGHYRGIDLDLTAIEIDGSIFDTDYDDRSRFEAKAPSVLKKIIRGGKKFTNLLKAVI